MSELKEIRNWSPDKMIERLHRNREALARLDDAQGKVEMMDECVIIFLEILRIVIKEKKWESSALDLFLPVFGNIPGAAGKLIAERFQDTRDLVKRYATANDATKKRLRPQLISRGML